MEPPKLGKLIEGEEHRDAIHVAIYPIEAGEALEPGEHVGIGKNGMAFASPKPIGIVDPFLKATVKKGQMFFMCLYPQTITSLRHNWTHPAFSDEEPSKEQREYVVKEADRLFNKKRQAREWLQKFCDRWNFGNQDGSYSGRPKETVDGIVRNALTDGWITAVGIDLHSAGELDSGDEEKFWQCVRDLGHNVSDKFKQDFSWSCTC